MKKYRNIFFLTLLSLTLLSFKAGDEVELENYLNARSFADFRIKTDNIKTTLTKGTRGEILETKKFNSGNFGLKLKIQNGAHKGESFWVYHNVKLPKVKLYTSGHTQTLDPEKAKQSVHTQNQDAIRSPEEALTLNAAKLTSETLANPKNNINPPAIKSNDCLFKTDDLHNPEESQYSELDLVTPYREISTSTLHSSKCNNLVREYEVCKDPNNAVESFRLNNHGPNSIVKKDEYYISREFSFEMPDRARSDLKLMISDSPDETTSHATYSVMIFLPRTVLPSIKNVGEELHVTLPTREVVRFNSKTKEIVGGVFSESPMEQDPKNKNKAVPAKVKYEGEGVMIRADKSGDFPHGDIELSNGTHAPSISTATISKKGHKDCKVPAKDIWFTDYSKGSNVFVKSELANDKGMDDFIKKRCGFSLY